MKSILAFLAISLALVVCATPPAQPAPTPLPTSVSQVHIPNPASVFCEEQGHRLEIRTTEDGSQTGMCIFENGSECEEWAYYRGECKAPGTQAPTAAPVLPEAYQGWWTYTHSGYGFSIMLPEDWIVEEASASDSLLNGHLLQLHPKYTADKENIRMTFRRSGEDTLLWPTGVGQGEFTSQGTLEVAGQPVQRLLLVCPGGEVTAIWYHQGQGQPNISRGGLEFGFIFSAGGHCQAGATLNGKTQLQGEMIISSLKVE